MADVPRVYTIGHSSHQAEVFLNLLTQHAIQVLVDVRSQPSSRAVPHFNAPVLKKALAGTNVKYLYLGRELGGRPSDPEFYDDTGRVLYFRLADSPLYQEGIRRLENGITKYRVAIMCSEENPVNCHRRLLIGRTLQSHGHLVAHIRGDGRIQSEEALATEAAAAIDALQPSFFEPAEASEWKSIRSVSLKRRPRNSSAR